MEDENIHHHQYIIASFINFRSPNETSPVVKALMGGLMADAGPKARRRLRRWMLTKLHRRIAQLRKQLRAMEDKMHWEGGMAANARNLTLRNIKSWFVDDAIR